MGESGNGKALKYTTGVLLTSNFRVPGSRGRLNEGSTL